MAEPRRETAAPPLPPAAGPPPFRMDRSRKPQFSLRAMLIAMTAFALVAALAGFIGAGTIVCIGAMLVVPVFLATLAIYSRGPHRAMFGGAFIGSLAPLIVFRGSFQIAGSLEQMLVVMLMLVLSIVSCGAAARLAQSLAERRGWDQPPRE